MGRKTWESIPPKFRPLRNRLNLVVSRSALASMPAQLADDGALWCSSLESAVKLLDGVHVSSSSSTTDLPRVARAFVIGGSQIYSAALEMEQTDSVLLTRVYGEWECDTFFPVDFDEDKHWRRESLDTLREWTGEEVTPGKMKEGNTEFEYRLYTRAP